MLLAAPRRAGQGVLYSALLARGAPPPVLADAAAAALLALVAPPPVLAAAAATPLAHAARLPCSAPALSARLSSDAPCQPHASLPRLEPASAPRRGPAASPDPHAPGAAPRRQSDRCPLRGGGRLRATVPALSHAHASR
eukprot:scaffold60730_cov75-Phaeocystis_antarctica.AAC.10